MGGVDLADQCVSYYLPNQRCHKNWVPMFLQILAMIRNNCYVIHLDHYGPKKDGHKPFTISFIQALIDQANALSVQEYPRIPRAPRLHTAYPTTASL
eukprot:12063435-Ditylum_brightwellii.AAC.1